MSMVAGRGRLALRLGAAERRSLDIITAEGPTNTKALARLDGHDWLLTPRGNSPGATMFWKKAAFKSVETLKVTLCSNEMLRGAEWPLMVRKRRAAHPRLRQIIASLGRMLLGSRFLGLTRSSTSTLTRILAMPTARYHLDSLHGRAFDHRLQVFRPSAQDGLASQPRAAGCRSFVKLEVEGIRGIWMRKYGVPLLELPDMAVQARAEEGHRYFDMFVTIFGYLRAADSRLAWARYDTV